MVGDGSRFLFWHDKWIEDVPLKVLYPELFLCSTNKEACISKVLSPPAGDNDKVWSLRFYRKFKITPSLHIYIKTKKINQI